MHQRALLDPNSYTPTAAGAQGGFHPDIVGEVSKAVAADPLVVVGMSMNPVVKKARKNLTEAGLAFTYLEYGSYLSEWKRRLAIKMWSGWPTFPQIYVKGVLIGGNKELEAAIASGDLKRWLEQGPPRA